MKYIKTGNILTLIEQADESNKPLYIMGPIGCGKTAALEYYYRRTSHKTIDCADGYIEEKTDSSKIRSRVIIFDNVSYLTDQASIEYVLGMLKKTDKHVIFTSRAARPYWLASYAFDLDMIVADYRNMVFQKEQVIRYLNENDINISDDLVYELMEQSRMNPLILIIIAFYLKGNEAYTDEINNSVRVSYHNYLEKELTGRLTQEETEFLLSICKYPVSTFEMAGILNEGRNCYALADSIIKKNAYALTVTYETIQLSKTIVNFLECKRDFEWSAEKNNKNLCAAAEYFLTHGDILQAMKCFEKGKEHEKAMGILEEYALNHPDAVSVYKMKEIYSCLTEEAVKDSWPLMGAMCMYESIMIRTSGSDFWYEKLKDRYESETDETVRKDIFKRIVYLDLMLPHRGNKNLPERIQNAIDVIYKDELPSPHRYSGLMPSTLHGSMDFCEMSKDEDNLYSLLNQMLVNFRGNAAENMTNILRAEIGYEKDTMDHFEQFELLNKGYMGAEADGSISGCFASVGVSVHLHLFRGEMNRAEELLEGIRKKTVNEADDILLGNIDALYSWVDQLHANRENVQAWMETSPDEDLGFSFFERSEMLNKVRAYIVLGRFHAALTLIERLMEMFRMYGRTYGLYETMLYKAIVYFRMMNADWKKIMTEVFRKACDLGYYHIICDHGVAVLPLLEKIKPSSEYRAYYDRLMKMARQMAENFPNYLATSEELKESLTKTERRVLHLLCEGLNADEICHLMDISYSGIKFHNKNIYKKLGASNRTEAVRIAFKLGLNEPGPSK